MPLSAVQVSPETRPLKKRYVTVVPSLFSVVSWGCAGTAWLARALNSHPDVFCVQSANHYLQSMRGVAPMDGLEYLHLIAAIATGHQAVGDVHGISRHLIPELWHLYNGRKQPGEHFRVFPLSNWTELDVWAYIAREQLPLPSLYFAHDRDVFLRQGTLLATSPYLPLQAGEKLQRERVRFRTVGDMTCTGAIRSNAASLAEIIAEVAASRQTERGTRYDDRRSDTAMEDRKLQGYF